MKIAFLTTLVSLTSGLFINAQTIQDYTNCDSATIVLTEKIQGFGPQGNANYGFGSLANLDSTALLAYPKFKNLPDSITGLEKYCVILDDYQFYYQNFQHGIYSKEYFLDKVKEQKWDLEDTVYLTKDMLKNTISVVVGYNSKKKRVYVVDVNNNGDFSDDTLRYLYSDLHSQEDILNNSYYVDYEFYNGQSNIKDKLLLTVRIFGGDNNGKHPVCRIFY
jgi:hypothetical protein